MINPDNPRLKIINEWLRDRLENPTKAEGTASFLTKFVKEGLTELTAQLCNGNSDDLIITVRSSFRKGNLYLRPVYSQPEQLRKFFQDRLRQKPFCFQRATAFDGIQIHETQELSNKPYSFAGLYPINSAPHPPESFRARINDFHKALSDTDGLRDVAINATTCFFAARNKDEKKIPSIDLKHILAVYFPRTGVTELGKQTFQELLEKAEDLFDGLDLISLIDASIFEAEGLKLVAELLPEFSRDDVAPADQIAFALERLRALLNRHMIGRHGGDKAGVPPRLFYIATSFERQTEPEKSVYPRLEIYPHIYRQEYLEASYFVTHRSIPSATKFLLWRYLRSKEHLIIETTSASKDTASGTVDPPVRCARAFEELFDANRLKTSPLQEWEDAITPLETPDFLQLTSGDALDVNSDRQTPWQALNKPLDPDLRSIAAFVVEGRIVETIDLNEGGIRKKISKQCLPRGIFAIESHYEDGFSDADIHSLRIVFQGIAALIRLISHQNAPIDYRSLIASTFKQDAELEDRSDPRVSRLIFLVQKLDAYLLHELLEKCRKCSDPLRVFGVEPVSLASLEEIRKICPPKDKPSPEERAKILKDRLQKLQRLLSGEDENTKNLKTQLLQENVLSFLEACPENFTWSSYLACMAQTLGDRIAGTKLPHFSRMLPGFSASGMFMAMVDGELRQVVKLSNARKLRGENKLYRKWVRYRLVNAARIPGNGLAFETTGEVGKQCGLNEGLKSIIPIPAAKDTASDGVLVSDLVSGGEGDEEVNTLLDLIATNVGRRSDVTPKTSTINNALKAVFGRNATLWKSIPTTEPWSQDPTTAVLTAFNIPLQDDDGRNTFEDDIARLRTLRKAAHTDLSFGNLLKLFRQTAPASLEELQLENFRICHGDLNSRNLTWAEELQSFFLIDFERVGPNVIGTDQFRLLVNLVSELRSGWDAAQDLDAQEAETGLANLYKELERGLSYLSKVFTLLIGPGKSPRGLDEIATKEAQARFADSKLVKTFATILKTVAPDKLKTANWRCHWALMMLCSAAKEFSYSCCLVDQQHINELLNGRKFDDTNSMREIETLVENYVADKPGLKNLTGNFMRYFVAARLLLNFVDCMKVRATKVRA